MKTMCILHVSVFLLSRRDFVKRAKLSNQKKNGRRHREVKQIDFSGDSEENDCLSWWALVHINSTLPNSPKNPEEQEGRKDALAPKLNIVVLKLWK